jgi:hypothetical protein
LANLLRIALCEHVPNFCSFAEFSETVALSAPTERTAAGLPPCSCGLAAPFWKEKATRHVPYATNRSKCGKSGNAGSIKKEKIRSVET